MMEHMPSLARNLKLMQPVQSACTDHKCADPLCTQSDALSMHSFDIKDQSYNLIRRNIDRDSIQDYLNEFNSFKMETVVDPTDVDEELALQLFPFLPSKLADELLEDVLGVAQAIASQVGASTVRLKSEVFDGVKCPKWHVDHVQYRALISYAGPGTQVLPNRFTRRQILPFQPRVGIVNDAEHHLSMARTGDVLVLRGDKWPGKEGLGAVHRSPPTDQKRLLVTIDDVIGDIELG